MLYYVNEIYKIIRKKFINIQWNYIWNLELDITQNNPVLLKIYDFWTILSCLYIMIKYTYKEKINAFMSASYSTSAIRNIIL